MGQTNEKPSKHKTKVVVDDTTLSPSDAKGMLRSASGANLQEQRYGNQFMPIEKLAKYLARQTEEQFGLSNGIVADIFAKYTFPSHVDLGMRLFRFFHHSSKAKTKHLGVTAFRQQVERFIGMLDDQVILENYLRMFGDVDKAEMIRPEHLRALLTTCYRLAMSHYSGPSSSCLQSDRSIDAVISSCFFTKEHLSSGYICKFLEQHCPRLVVPPLHKYCVHLLTTAHRNLDAENYNESPPQDISTPVLDKGNPFTQAADNPSLLPVSLAWLLGGTLPKLYIKSTTLSTTASGTNLASHAFMSKILSTVPSHWTLLYDSQMDGLGSNRYLHHVLGYKGPTLTLIKGENDLLVCVACSTEWRESYMYIGGDDCCIIQLMPKFVLIEQGPKLLYLNTATRGYPKGLRAGKDPKKPVVALNEGFDKFDFRGISNNLYTIEVWGCGDVKSRETQLELKKWQIKEAEKQRIVKISADDWIDHPDRYLLELGGRPQYNNQGK